MIQLRALEPEDIDFLYYLENDKSLWELSDTQTPFSRYVLKKYIENAHLDIYQTRQVRFVITYKGEAIGCADLYDFNSKDKRASVGIAIVKSFRRKGFGKKALQQLCDYAFLFLDIHQLTAYIPEENIPSQKLFENVGFSYTISLKDWLFSQGEFKNIFLYQYFKP